MNYATRSTFWLWLAFTIAVLAASASAARAPSPREAAVIRRLSMSECSRDKVDPYPCTWRGGLVSTADARYAWGKAYGEGFSGVLLKRPFKRSLRFHVVAHSGGGANTCSWWYQRAPRRVIRDLKVPCL
jgi:hypothetical protein